MTTFEQGSSASRLVADKPEYYDIHAVDQFYGHCQAVARTHQQRKARLESQRATRRTIVAMALATGLLCYFLFERFF
jgi:hypothetical protein